MLRICFRWRILLFVLCAAMPVLAAPGGPDVAQPSLDQGYRQMYNLDFAAAHQTFHAYQQARPEDAFGFVSDAAAYLFSEFDRLHILESDLFTDDRKFEDRKRPAPDPAIKTAFVNALSTADQLATRALAANAQDTNAMLAQVMADGLRGDYAALIEKRNLAGLSYMKSGRTLAQKLLSIKPDCYDAYLAIGVENYLLGVSPAPLRWVLRMTGSQTDKDEGLKRLQMTAEKGHYLAPFARLLLAVAALRDKDSQTARTILASLATEFPHNPLYAKELARIP